MLATVRREIDFSDNDIDSNTAGKVLDLLLELDFVVAVTYDTRTPSSFSQPALVVTLRDAPENRQAVANFFCDDLEELDFVEVLP